MKLNFFLKKRAQIFIDYEYQYTGGPRSFMMNLKKYLESQNFFTTKNINEAKAIFFATRYYLDKIKFIKERGGAIIQRLDGVYSFEIHGEGYQEIPDYKYAKEIYQNYTTHYIFQSEYSKKQCVYSYGEPRTSNVFKIINGCDTKKFFPSNKDFDPKAKVKFITDGFIRNLSMIEPMVLALDEVSKKFNIELHVIGKVEEDLKKHLDREYIVFHGLKDLDYIAKELRKADIYIFTQLNPPCPNSIIQAVSSGLPIVTFDSGSMKELLFFNEDLLAPLNNKLFHKNDDINIESLVEKIFLAITDFDKFKSNSLKNSKLYTLSKMGEDYLQIFKQVL